MFWESRNRVAARPPQMPSSISLECANSFGLEVVLPPRARRVFGNEASVFQEAQMPRHGGLLIGNVP